MIRRTLPYLSLLLILAACAGGSPPEPPTPAPYNPAGTWDFSISVQGQSFDGVMTIDGSPEEGFTGTVDSQMGSADLGRVTYEGNTMRFSVPDADASASITFEGEQFSGEMSSAAGALRITGVRRQAPSSS